ncbi:hypothetical protein Pmani_002694 [Petrolisthes manimaculis]|uniref:Uncharacterized protein n=1 Tax=Petrolisthes manimaculis TaxID=1843537 RepID=A0AAE1UK50_9EUCA|nr:hypothetical protein Pmani_002694 [Petrolisthes manimaculis]
MPRDAPFICKAATPTREQGRRARSRRVGSGKVEFGIGGGRLTSPALNWSEEDDMRVNMQSRAGQRARGKQGKGWRWRQGEKRG